MSAIQEWLTRPDGLADRLHVLRTQAGLSGKEMAEANGWPPSRVSKLELGQQMPTVADLERWVETCGADAAAQQELRELLDEAQAQRTAFKRRTRRGLAPVQHDYNRIVAESQVIRYFETAFVPGFLQTADYARCVLTEMRDLHGAEIDDIEAAVATRLRRQQMLYDPGKRFELLVAEPVLRWLICPPDVMRGQLDRLQTVIGAPNIRFGIVPMGVRLKTTPQNAFQIYDDLVIVEGFVGEETYQDERAAAYGRAMDLLWEEAVTGDDARHYIARAIEALPTAL